MSFQENYFINVILRGNAKAYDALKNAVAGLATAAFTADVALAGLAVSAAADITSFAKMGNALGMTTQSAREMTAVFAAAGMEADSVGDILGQLSGKAQDAREGNEGWITDFKTLGINMATLKKDKPDELFADIAQGLSGIADATQRAALADKLFGGDAKKLLPILMHGKMGIQALKKEVSQFGGVVTPEASEEAKNLTDNLRKMGVWATSLKTRIGNGLIPIVGRMTDKMIAWAEKNEDWINLKLDQSIKLLTKAFEELNGPLGQTIVGLGALKSAEKAIGIFTALGTALRGAGAGAAVAEGSMAALLGPGALLVGAILVLEDLYQAATGGKSVFMDMANYLGAGSEFQAALLGIGHMFQSIGEWIMSMGRAFISVIPQIKDFLSHMVGMQTFLEIIEKLWNYLPSVKEVFGWVATKTEAVAMNMGDDAAARNTAALERTAALAITPPDSGVYTPPAIESRQYTASGANVTSQQVSIVVNATGLDEAAATRLAQKVVQAEILGAQDAANQGVR